MKRSKYLLFLLAIVGLLFLVPVQTQAYTTNIYLDSFQDLVPGTLTGEIYYHTTDAVPGGPIASPSFSYCVDRTATIVVPGAYYGEAFPVTAPPEPPGRPGGNKAAWLIDNYAYSKHGVLTGFNNIQTGVIVQLAVWDVTDQGLAIIPGYETLFSEAAYLVSAIPSDPDILNAIGNNYRWIRLYNDSSKEITYQDIMAPVPIPSALLLVGPGLVGLAGMRRKFKK